jgi:hypothetical protein
MFTPTACCVPAIRRFSISSTATTATALATIARSRSAAPRRRWSTPTSAAATTWTPRSASSGRESTTADVVKLWPKAQEFGFANEEAAFALQYGHGVGLSIWEKPIFSRLVSLDHPEVIEEGMVFALETYWPASDGWSAARLEEEVVVTKDGCEVITRFPSEKLLVAGTHYFTTGGELSTTRETQSNLNNPGALERVTKLDGRGDRPVALSRFRR